MSHLLLLFFIPAPPVRWGKHKGATGEGCRGSAWQDLWGICLCSLLMDGPTALLPRAHGLSPGRSDKNPSARKRLVWLCRAFPNTGLPRQGGWVTMGERGDRVSGECIPSCCLCSVWQGFPCCRNPQLHGGGQGDAGINATPKGQLGQATAYGSAGQECPHPTPSGAAQIPTGWSWTPGCSLWHTQKETPHLQHNTCAGFSP